MNKLERTLGLFFVPLIWFVSADIYMLVSPALLPPLKNVGGKLYFLLHSQQLHQDILATFSRWSMGFVSGALSGTLCGLLLGLSKKAMRYSEFTIEFFRSMPVTAIFPLFLMIFGIGDESKIAMAFLPSFLLMIVNTTYGVTLAEPLRRKVARSFGATNFQIFSKIVLMDALPQIFVGLRLALAQSLIVTVVSEMFIGTDYGLGQRVYDSYLTNSIQTLYATLIILGTIGYVANRCMLLIESRTVFWTGK